MDFGRQTMEIDFVADQPGRTRNENAEFDLPLDGRSYVLKLDEEDMLQVEEVSDEDLFGGELEEQLLGDLSLEVPFAGLLPWEPVQVGEPFELETSGYVERALHTVLQCADALDEWEGMEGAAISTSARWILDEVELEGTGTLREVEGGIATIDYAGGTTRSTTSWPWWRPRISRTRPRRRRHGTSAARSSRAWGASTSRPAR